MTAMTFIQSQTLSSPSAIVTFSSIPQTFTHLQVRFTARQTTTNRGESVLWGLNNLTANGDYAGHWLSAEGGSVSSSGSTDSNGGYFQIPSGGTASNIFGVGIIDILDYANTSKNKTIRTIGGFDSNGSSNGQDFQYIALVSNLAKAQGTAATTSVSLYCYVYAGGSGFAVGSRFDLYGISVSAQTGA